MIVELLHHRIPALASRARAEAGNFLHADEWQRVFDYRHEDDRDRFIVARWMLKTRLSERMGCKPCDLVLRYSSAGRPAIEHPLAPDFSISHSRESVLIGLAWNGKIGVDIEYGPPALEERFAAKVLAESEHAEWNALAPAHRSARLMDFWVAKESFLKLNGVGLAYRMKDIRIDDRRCTVQACTGNLLHSQGFLLRIDAGTSAKAAVVTSSRIGSISYFGCASWVP